MSSSPRTLKSRARAAALGAALAVLVATGLAVPSASASAQVSAPTPSSQSAPASSDEQSVTLVNQDTNGNPRIRFDVDGNAIDAHDGQIQRFGDLYYLYGTSYGCGYEWNTPGAPFCGFVSYTSPDLVHWTPQGELFDASTTTWQDRCDGRSYGCYRPHVVFNEQTGRYVLWINTYDSEGGYRVFTATTPTGPFTEADEPELAAPKGPPGGVNYGDHQVFVDHDGQAYLTVTDWLNGGDLIVERLDDSYTSGSGDWTRVHLRSTEAPTMFERDGTYYLTYSDPNRGYATTGTGYVTAPDPLGPWTGTGSTPDAWTVAEDGLTVAGGGVGLSATGDGWTDYTFRASATPLEAGVGGYAQMGFVVRASDVGSYQWLIGNYPHAGATGGNLTKIIPGQGVQTVPLPMPIVTGQQYDVAITVTGSVVETRIDGVLVDTTTATASTTGRVGLRESQPDGERVLVRSASVTAPDGTVLLDDDFENGLGLWDRPAPTVVGTNITTTSCGGQPTDVLPIETSGGTVFLYQSDVWMDAKANEALAKHYWQPLEFGPDGEILPITCDASADVTIPVGPEQPLPEPPAVTTGDQGFLTHWDIRGDLARAQGMTIPDDGLLTAVRISAFRSGAPDAPLELELRETDGSTIGDVVASTQIPATDVSWAATWQQLTLDTPHEVRAGEQLTLVARTSSTTGTYGFAYSDTTPYAGGAASISHDAGSTWAVEEGRVLRVEADVETADEDLLDLQARPRCMAGKAYVAVRAVNLSDEAVDITLTTPFGTRTEPKVEPGASAYQSFPSRSASVPGGVAGATGTREDGTSRSYETSFDEQVCG